TYHDFLTARGVPQSTAIYPMKDVVADVNLDTLHAVAWDKGCFIGQEVTARMRYRGLAKKRLFAVTGAGIAAGATVSQNGKTIGDIRQSSHDGARGLAVLRIAAVAQQAEKP